MPAAIFPAALVDIAIAEHKFAKTMHSALDQLSVVACAIGPGHRRLSAEHEVVLSRPLNHCRLYAELGFGEDVDAGARGKAV